MDAIFKCNKIRDYFEMLDRLWLATAASIHRRDCQAMVLELFHVCQKQDSITVSVCAAEDRKRHLRYFLLVTSGQTMVTHLFILICQTMNVDLPSQ